MADRDEYATIVIEREGGVGTFLIGALIGAGAALLLAPRSGLETRTEIRAGMNRLRDRAEEGMRGLQENVSGRYDEVRTEVKGRVSAARDAFDSGRRAASERMHETGSGMRAGYEAARRPLESDTGGAGESEL